MITGKFPGIPESWAYIIKTIMTEGEENNTEYGDKSKYVNGLAIELTQPREDTWHPKDPFCTKNRLEEYKKQFKRGYKHGFAYTYMDRLSMYPVIPLSDPCSRCDKTMQHGPWMDQLDFIAGQLKAGRFESRRLQAITWVPMVDADPLNKEPPCLQRIWVYPRPGKTLDVHINYRSWDMFKGYEANINAILWMIREELLDPTGYRLNAFRALADNCHVYAVDWPQARAAIGLNGGKG